MLVIILLQKVRTDLAQILWGDESFWTWEPKRTFRVVHQFPKNRFTITSHINGWLSIIKGLAPLPIAQTIVCWEQRHSIVAKDVFKVPFIFTYLGVKLLPSFLLYGLITNNSLTSQRSHCILGRFNGGIYNTTSLRCNGFFWNQQTKKIPTKIISFCCTPRK